jgi:hypothetical protein
VHDVQVPKWVQKRKQVYPSDDGDVSPDDYEQPRRAVKVAVNMRFSLIAIGTHWYVGLGAEVSVTGLMISMHLVVMWNTRASLHSMVSHQNLKCWRPFNLIISKKEGRSVPWNGARTDTSLRSVGRRVGPFGALLVGAWHGVLDWRIRQTKASTTVLLRDFCGGTEPSYLDSKTYS